MTKKIYKLGVEIEGTRLTPLRFSHVSKGCSFYVYRCRCGTEKTIRKYNVKNMKWGTKSCGCRLKELQKDFGKNYSSCRKGQAPWNKGKSGYPGATKGRVGWRRGKVMLRKPNGEIVWVKVSDEKIGSHSKYYER